MGHRFGRLRYRTRLHRTRCLIMNIRTCTPADHAQCLRVFDSNTPRYFAPAERAEFASFLQAATTDFLVLEHEGVVVGCGGWYVRASEGRLCWGMIHQALHRQSAGSALLRARIDRLFSATRVDRVGLETSQHSAPFFARFGFVIDGVETGGFAEDIDCVRMSVSRHSWLLSGA